MHNNRKKPTSLRNQRQRVRNNMCVHVLAQLHKNTNEDGNGKAGKSSKAFLSTCVRVGPSAGHEPCPFRTGAHRQREHCFFRMP